MIYAKKDQAIRHFDTVYTANGDITTEIVETEQKLFDRTGLKEDMFPEFLMSNKELFQEVNVETTTNLIIRHRREVAARKSAVGLRELKPTVAVSEAVPLPNGD